MINLTVSELINSVNIMNKLAGQECGGGTALKIARLMRELKKEVETFNEERQKLINKYCVKDEETGSPKINDRNEFVIDPAMIEESNEAFNSLLATEIEINANKLSMRDIEGFTINAQDLMTIGHLIEE